MGKVVCIHQPNYLPWIGYFHKIHCSDIFVFLDDVQYPKGQVVNRNKIKTPNGEHYLTVPVFGKGHFGQLISEVTIDNHIAWKKNHWKSILFNYSKAPYFSDHSHFFEELYQKEWELLSELNVYIIRNIAEMLDMDTKFIRSSGLDIEENSTKRLIDIVKAVGGNTYLSGTYARGYQDESSFKENDIELMYQDFQHPTYNQLFGEFIPKMSIIDLLFNEGKKSKDFIRGA